MLPAATVRRRSRAAEPSPADPAAECPARQGPGEAREGSAEASVRRFRHLLVAVVAAGVLCMATVVPTVVSAPLPSPWRLLFATLLLIAGDVAVLHIRFGHNNHSFTWSETAMVIGLVLVPPAWMPLLAPAAVVVAHAAARRPPLKIAFNTASVATEAYLAAVVLRLVTGGTVDPRSPETWAGLALGALSFFAWNSVTVSAAVALSQGLPFTAVYGKGLLLNALVSVGNTAAGILLVAMSGSVAMLVVVPALVVLLYLEYRSYLRAMTERDTWKVLQVTSRELLRMEPDEVAQVVIERTPALFQAEFVEVLIVDGEPGTAATLFRWMGSGRGERFEGDPFTLAGAFWPRVLCEREPFELNAATAPGAQRRELESLGLETCVVAPLLSQRGCLGTLRIGFPGRVRFRTRDRQVLTTFANHVGSALHNTQLFAEMRNQALHDPLTGLPNRTLLLDRLLQAQARVALTPLKVAVLFCDLDRFKVINDSLGHQVGDELLLAVADRLQQNLRPGDTATRFGGDEFVVVCPDVYDEEQALDIAGRLAAILSEPFPLPGDDVYLTVSVGVALSGDPTGDPAALLRDADAAMYQAKEGGRARCALFDDTMRERAVARLEVENDLRRALDRDELQLHYQPTVRLSDGQIIGVEALVRWEHPTRGLVPPGAFIPLAEEIGLIVPLGAWVVTEACRQLARWLSEQLVSPEFTVAVNLSPHQLVSPGLVETIAAAVRSSGIDASHLCVEITEGALVEDAKGAIEVLRRLRRLGVQIALDDFGTGYSALSYLHVLPVDVLKIDRSFVGRLGPDPRDRAIIAGLVELAHALSLTVVAEGVETPAQAQDLDRMKCDVAQGFFFSKPVRADVLEQTFALPSAAGPPLTEALGAPAGVTAGGVLTG